MYTVNKKFQKLIILANCEFSSMKHQLYSSKKKKKASVFVAFVADEIIGKTPSLKVYLLFNSVSI